MPFHNEESAADRFGFRELAIALGVIGVALAGGIGILFAVRRRTQSNGSDTQLALSLAKEQAITIKAPIRAVEAAWVEWCAENRLTLKTDYAVRFEPAPGARGTEVHLVGGGSPGTLREVLHQFKQGIETGEVPMPDGPGPSRPRSRATTAG